MQDMQVTMSAFVNLIKRYEGVNHNNGIVQVVRVLFHMHAYPYLRQPV